MDILNRIKELQNEKGWSNYQLSVETEIPQSTINNMFTRNTLPSVTTLLAICKALEISLSQFFMEEDCKIILTEDEQSLVMAYRNLNKKNREIILDLANKLK